MIVSHSGIHKIQNKPRLEGPYNRPYWTYVWIPALFSLSGAINNKWRWYLERCTCSARGAQDADKIHGSVATPPKEKSSGMLTFMCDRPSQDGTDSFLVVNSWDRRLGRGWLEGGHSGVVAVCRLHKSLGVLRKDDVGGQMKLTRVTSMTDHRRESYTRRFKRQTGSCHKYRTPIVQRNKNNTGELYINSGSNISERNAWKSCLFIFDKIQQEAATNFGIIIDFLVLDTWLNPLV